MHPQAPTEEKGPMEKRGSAIELTWGVPGAVVRYRFKVEPTVYLATRFLRTIVYYLGHGSTRCSEPDDLAPRRCRRQLGSLDVMYRERCNEDIKKVPKGTPTTFLDDRNGGL
jgi:hypothetical protein